MFGVNRQRLGTVGRYALGEPIASGGMATVHLGRLVASAGFSRTVAIKRMHPHLCEDPSFVESFADEARLVARIRHPNVAPTLDVVRADGELLIVMEYVDGESLSALSRGRRVPIDIAVAIVSEMLHGLHAAHEAKSEDGKALGIVHRDVSPQNVIVGADGVARLLDFGIARTTARVTTTRQDEVKGKLAYMAPEQIRREGVTRKTDVFAAGVVLWELLTGQRLFASENEGATLEKILVGWVAPPSTIDPDVPPKLDEIALRALEADPEGRFETARDMAIALEDAVQRALGREVSAWVEKNASASLARRRQQVEAAEKQASGQPTPSVIVGAMTGETAPRGQLSDHASAVTVQAGIGHIDSAPPPPPAVDDEPTLAAANGSEHAPAAFLEAHEPTVTSFAEDSMNLHWASAAPSQGRQAPPTKKPTSAADRIAIAIFVLAATTVLFFGARHRLQPEPARDLPAAAIPIEPAGIASVTGPAPSFAVPAPEAAPATLAPAANLAPPDNVPPTSALPVEPAPSFTVTTTPILPPKRSARPKAAPAARSPCVAKTDAATGKRIYQGDCD